MRQLRGDIFKSAQHIPEEISGTVGKIFESRVKAFAGYKSTEEVFPAGLDGAEGAGERGRGLRRGDAGEAELALDGVDRVVDVAEVVDIILDAGDRLRVREEALHFVLRAAVSELEVIKQRILPAGEALVGRLDALDRRAHFGRVVGHVLDRGICGHHGLHRVAAEGLLQSGAHADGLLGVGVCAHTEGRRVFGVDLHHAGGVAVDRVEAAEALLERGAGLESSLEDLADRSGGEILLRRVHQLAARLFAGGGARGLGGAAEELGDLALDARSLRDDIHISVSDVFSHWRTLLSWKRARRGTRRRSRSPLRRRLPPSRGGRAGCSAARFAP